MTRAEHLQWAQERALAYVDLGELGNAWASLTSDLRKHEDLAEHGGLELGAMLLLGGHLDSPQEMRTFIEGFR